jgi:hypothetical protein
MVEAGGVEPPSEKRYGSKPTCLGGWLLLRGFFEGVEGLVFSRLVLNSIKEVNSDQPLFELTGSQVPRSQRYRKVSMFVVLP